MGRENERLATAMVLKEMRERLANKESKAISEAEERRNQFLKNREKILETAEMKRRRHNHLLEMCRNNAFATAIKGIFIGALEAGTLTDRGVILAESMVDNWIKEKGGARKILGECKNNTYLLHRISEIVEEAAILETEEIEDIDNDKIPEDNKEDDSAKETPETPNDEEVEKAMDTIKEKLKGDEEAQKALKVIQTKVDPEAEEEPEKEESSDNKEDDSLDSDDLDVEDDIGMEDTPEISNNSTEVEEPEKEESSNSSEETSESDENDDSGEELDDDNDSENNNDIEDDSEEDNTSDDLGEDPTDGEDSESEIADDITDDIENPDEDLSVDGEPESKGKVLDDLEKEEDVQKAVELIRQRVADAEENFIKRNAEDKKQVEELIGRISDNVKTVEDIADEDDPESKVAQESARSYKRKINEITSKRPLTIMEKMTRLLHANIVRDQVVREAYLDEDSKTIDTGLVVESAKVMYGFLETINTLQLEKVDAEYIKNVLDGMKG